MRIKLHDGGWAGPFANEKGIFRYLRFDVLDAPAEYLHFKLDHSFFRAIDPKGNEKAEEWTERLTALALARLSGVETDAIPSLLASDQKYPTIEFTLDEANAGGVAELPKPKACRYQAAGAGDLYCSIAKAPNGIPPIPTTKALCLGCGLPDSRWACDHLHHAVVGFTGGPPVILKAMCDLGRAEVEAGAHRCRPGGHSCWERTVDLAEGAEQEVAPLALHESIDYLDAMWKGTFGVHLLRLRGAGVLGKLATPCVSQSDFESKLSALADTINSFDVRDEDLEPNHRGDHNYGPGRTLARLRSALAHRASSGAVDEEGLRLGLEGIQVLQKAMALRTAFQHTGGGAAGKLPMVFAAFGLPIPPPAPPASWNRVRGRVLRALDSIRQVLRQLS
jgi:hypothetical protein